MVAVLAVFNFVQNYATLKLTRRIYDRIPEEAGEPVASLSLIMG
jgi:hypothetical protein